MKQMASSRRTGLPGLLLDTTRIIKEGPNTAQKPCPEKPVLSGIEGRNARSLSRTDWAWSLPSHKGEKDGEIDTICIYKTTTAFRINQSLVYRNG